MERCDVLIVGGGPAGSACAAALRRYGLDVIVVDRAVFPRDKVCAGWITPQVVEDLALDLDDYARGRTLQPIVAFRTGFIDGPAPVDTVYDHPVSYGIRRCEFDHYLLERSGARLESGAPVSSLVREGGRWIVNDEIAAPMLVGAGGHFCPVAKWLNPAMPASALVVAQEAEFPIGEQAGWAVRPERPELYFTADLRGYGWCFRKGACINIGFGRLAGGSLPHDSEAFARFLRDRGRIPDRAGWKWRGHAYLLAERRERRVVDDHLLLIGDAAGLAYSQSGEGIRPAIESGLLAASVIAAAHGDYAKARLEPYAEGLRRRFATPLAIQLLARAGLPAFLTPALLPRLMASPWFVRHWLLDRGFLRANEPALARRPAAPVAAATRRQRL